MQPLLLNIPSSLFRFFDRDEYASDFVERGRIRLRRLEYFRTIEGAFARDEDEGDGRLLVPGMVPRVAIDAATGERRTLEPIEGHFSFGTLWTNPTYVFCTSLPHVDVNSMVHDRPFVTRVFSPERFADALNASLRRVDFREREVFRVEGMPVRYDKDEVAERPDDISERIRLSVAQKHKRFAVECEYRFAVYLSEPQAGAPEYLDLLLESPSDFCVREVRSAAV